MVVSILLGRAGGEAVVPRPSPVAELCACLHALADPPHHPRSAAWVSAASEGLTGPLAADAARLAPLWGAFRARYLLPLVGGPERGLDEELADVERLPRSVFVQMTAQALVGQTQRELFDPELSGPAGREARTALRARLRLISPRHRELGERLLADPEELRSRLLIFLEAVGSTVFDAEWARLRPRLRADAVERRRQRHERGAGVLADLPIATAHDDPPRVDFDKIYHATVSLAEQPCVLVPSVHVAPHIVIKHFPGHPTVVQYPIAAAASEAPPLDLVRTRLAVLSDATRMRLCYDLLRTPCTTSDLAARARMTLPQVSRHLRRLREAGLVVGERQGAVVRYRLDLAAVNGLGPDLLAALRR
ncbi:ArsR/SmtB family transcription factor [Allonocardiopsis opalescens]|uniref:DNA-binding transcriptional ArsR family regulator n=1 Tax=Allonocardiopsis opalescens TaxID=1144618 RepID=A0A2T0QEE4_9ACTN|nr:DUF5937 family protein [Allonocardiopsis opalescens]PRY02316.1 DNA-binding transcriptional ArsR family regulator [Allonocardiopsis opalescens]